MTALRPVTVYYDYVSPFAYLASEVLPEFAKRHGLRLAWTPIELEALSHYAEGPPYSPAKRRYVVLDALRQAELHGVPIATPQPFPVASAGALRLAGVASEHARFAALHRELFRAAWRDQRDLARREVLASCIEGAGGPVEAWLSRAEAPEASRRLADATAAAETAGVFGVPSLCLEGELFWGLDSLPALAWRLSHPHGATEGAGSGAGAPAPGRGIG